MNDICGLELFAKLLLRRMFLLFEGDRGATRPKEVKLHSDLVLEFVELCYACLELRFHEIKYIGLLAKQRRIVNIQNRKKEENGQIDVLGLELALIYLRKDYECRLLALFKPSIQPSMPPFHSPYINISIFSPIESLINPCISVYNSNQMLQNRSQFQSNQEASLLSSQLKQYRKINSNLRKKIKQKDNQIQQLFGYIQDVGLAFSSNNEGYLIKGQITQQRSHKLALSDNRKREKENKASEFFQESNIFKQPSYSLMTRNSRPEVHLPVLDKKNKNIFQDQAESSDKRAKVIRISLEKLKPLNPEEVKKRFLMKYQRQELNE